jgi:hypothetical protein
MKHLFRRRMVLLGAILLMALFLSAATEYYCQQFGCVAQFMCMSETTPRRVGVCMFQCREGGGWLPTYYCEVPII